jgi:hypothetical protein
LDVRRNRESSVPSDDWSVVETFGDPISAEALVGLLESEKLPCRFASNEVIRGLSSGFSVLVPTELQRKAQWIRAQAPVSEEELTYFATGELPGGGEKS